MREWQSIFIAAAILTAFAGCNDKTADKTTKKPAIGFGAPSLSGLAEHAKPEALSAFENAKRFVSNGSIDVSPFDLTKPSISHWCPPQPEYHDWLIRFPVKDSASGDANGLCIAVLNDGKCWVWPRFPTDRVTAIQ